MKKAIVVTMSLVLLTGCTPSASDTAPDSENLALIEDVNILMLESFPVQVNAEVKGTLRNGCEVIDEITTNRENNTFVVRISVEEEGEVCTQALVPFEEVVGLDVEGLRAGEYTVDVNGVEETFTLQQDNTTEQ